MIDDRAKKLHEALVAAGISVESVRLSAEGAWEFEGPSGSDLERAQQIARDWRPGPGDLSESEADRLPVARVVGALAVLAEDPGDAWAKGVVAKAAAQIKAARSR